MIKEEEEGEDSEVDGVTNSLGVLKVDPDKGKSLYFGDSHWHLVLADVSLSEYILILVLWLFTLSPIWSALISVKEKSLVASAIRSNAEA